jgi:acyl carrier protein phosphodiesterase
MNFLVHAWLSYPNRELTWGNLYADAFKGSSYKKLPEVKANGVALHRQIDVLTDEHDIVRNIIQSIRPIAGKMAPIYVDVAFDYWLHRYLEDSHHDASHLIDFVHEVLQDEIPKEGKMTRMLPFLLSEHWLTRYGTYDGISAAMNGLNYRMSMKYDVNKVLESLLANDGLMAKHAKEMFEYLKKELS